MDPSPDAQWLDRVGTATSPARGHSPGHDAAHPSEPPTSVAARIITLLELVSLEGEQVGVREAARKTGIDRSAVSRLFAQLEGLGMLHQVGDRGGYTIGPRLFSLAGALRARDNLWNAARQILERLVDEYNETCYLTVREGDRVVFREKVDSNQTIRYVVVLGRPFRLTTGAAGRAILSALEDAEIDRILAQGLAKHTANSITDPAEYRAQLMEDRARGYACSIGQWVRNGSGVAAPYFDAGGECAGAITMSLPADRLDRERIPEMGHAVLSGSMMLSYRLGYRGGWGPVAA